MKESINHIHSPANANLPPQVSIIIVTYNAAAELEDCLQSIFQQPLQNYELLVLDGASTDGTVNIIRQYEARISYWHSRPDKGIYDAMNQALPLAKGSWLYFMGADDRLLKGFATAITHLQQPGTLYYGYCEKDDGVTNASIGAYDVAKINICHQAVFYPRSVFDTAGYETRFSVYADHALNIRCWGNKKLRKQYLPYGIARYNTTGFSSYAKDPVFEIEKAAWIRQHMSTYVYLRYLWRKWKARKKKETDFI